MTWRGTMTAGLALLAAAACGVVAPQVTAVPPADPPTSADAITAAPSPAAPTAPAATPPAVAAPRLYVVGDSLTSGAEVDILEPGEYPPDSWLAHLGSGVEVASVWAVPGTTTADMRLAAVPTRCDWLVLMAGENDVDQGRDWADIVADIVAIVDASQAPRVLLVGPTPTDYDLATGIQLNERLAQLARDLGWRYLDAAVDVRDPDGAWLPGMSEDGTHPNATSAPLVAARIEAAVRP